MGRPVVDLTGQRFGMLTVDYLYPEDRINKTNGRKQKQWYCTCDCGNHRIITGDYLKLGYAKSCGCTNKQECFTGKSVGKLTVGESFKRGKATYYHCVCKCGNRVDVSHYALRDEKRLSCGKCERAIRPYRVKDLVGYKVGRLTVLNEEPLRHITSGGNIVVKWKCQCECGQTTYVSASALKNKKIKSCGCLLAEKNNMTQEEYKESYHGRPNQNGLSLDLTGKRFGKLIAIESLGYKEGKTKWKCRCDCGNYVEVQTSNLTNGHTQSCGCINSVGESIIGRYLENHKIEFKRNYRDQRCKDKRALPFDFALFNNGKLIGIIEYDGEQHFEIVRFNGMTYETAVAAYQECVKHDQLKNQFCEKYNIPLLRIKYDCRDDIEILVDQFLDVISYEQIA